MTFRGVAVLILLLCFSGASRQTSPQLLLDRALRLADLYNWVDAGPSFSAARFEFTDLADQRNALWTKPLRGIP